MSPHFPRTSSRRPLFIVSSGIALVLAIGVVLSSGPVQVFGFLPIPSAAAGFGALPIPSAALGYASPGVPVTDLGEKIWRIVSEALKTVGDIMYKRALSTFLNNLAYNTAIKVATGGKGQQPLFETDLSKIAKDAGDAAVGDYLNKEVAKLWGRSLCEPITPAGKVRIQILAGVQKPAQPRAARCPLSRIINNVRSTNNQVLVEFQKSFDPSASDLGAVLVLQTGKQQRKIEAEEARKLAKLIEGPFKSVIDNVSGKIKTPAALIGGTLESILPQSLQPQIQYTGNAIADAIGIFTKTLSSKWLERIFGKGGGFNPNADISGVNFSGTAGIINAREQFASLIVPDFGSTQGVDVLNQLQIDNILDPGFAEAVRQRLSVRDAVQQGLLNGQKIFGYEASGTEPDFRSGYPYASMKYLRKYRIIPVGWEIAAQYIREYETGTRTLGQVMDAYEDATSPYYRLVDPNWTLTVPEHVCRRTGFTEHVVKNSCRPVPLDSSDLFRNPDFPAIGTPNAYDDLNADNDFTAEGQARELQESSKLVCTREEQCVDEQSCIVTNPDGTCKEFGYCTEDRPIWRFNGTACDPQFVSCLAVADPDGNSASYLQDTLDFNSCDASNAGCQWLCRDYDPRNSTFSCENTYASTVPASASGALQYLGAIGVQGASGIAVAADGTVYAVSQTQHVIYRLNADLTTANVVFGTTGASACNATQLTAPRGIDVDKSNGTILVADTGCSRLLRINPTTFQVMTSTAMGSPVRDIASDYNGNVFTVSGTIAVQKRSAINLAVVLANDNTPPGSDNSGVAVDLANNVYVAAGQSHYVMKFDNNLTGIDLYPLGPSGTEATTAYPVGVDVDTVGQVYVTEQPIPGPGGNRVYILNPAMDQKFAVFGAWGVTGAGENGMNTPSAIAVSNEGAYVADRGNDRVIQLSSSQGTQCVRDDGDTCTVAPGNTSCTVECVLPTACTGPSCTCVTASGRSCAVAVNTDRCTIGGTTCTLDNSKRYLDRDAGTCDEESAGCREFLRIEQTNRVANGSFEYLDTGSAVDDAAEDTFKGWAETPAGSIVAFATSSAFFGTTTLQMEDNGNVNDRMRFPFNSGYAADGRTFTLSVYGRTAVAGTTCTTRVGLSSLLLAGVENGVTADVDLTNDWQRFFLTYTVPQDGRRNDVIVSLYEDSVAGACAAGTDMLFDGVQVEETTTVTNYKDYGSAGGVTLTEERKACLESEAGCDEYTSTSTGERIPGVVRPGDQCPADQVGCKGYREEPLQSFPSRPVRDYINPPASISYLAPFITPTARSCSAQYEGCAEYTNLDIVAQGGEGREYYTSLRLCVLPDDPAADIESFYSWSGSATTGFQLNVHQLLGSNTDNGPCSNVNQAVQPFNTCDDANFPDLNEDGLLNDRDCQPVYGDNPDCQEYFDAAGTVYYRYRSRTITSSDDCHPLRETEKRCVNAGPSQNHYCSTDAECGGGGDCEAVIFHAIPSENVSCPAGFAGCREYRGNTGGNSQVVFHDDFEDGDTAGWTAGVTITNESLQFGGHSATTGNQAVFDVANIVRDGGTYELSLWGKRTGAVNSIQALTGQGGCHAALPFFAGPAISLTDQWQKITIGPFHYDTAPCSDETLWITTLGSWFFDNVELREITDNPYFVHDSWTTCDAANVGCDRYRDRQGRDRFISSFTSLCREEAIGCEAMNDTQNSSNPYAQTFRSGQPAEVVVPDDAMVYRVNDPQDYCQLTEKGCTRLGTPSIGADGLVSDWQTTYRIDDPDQYDATLCGHLETGCQEYTTDEGAIQYFRSPTAAQCEYRENITVGGNAPPASGWYKTTTTSGSPDCPTRTSGITPTGVPKSICVNSGDPAVDGQNCVSDEDCRSGGVLAGTCQYWVGSCPGTQSTCSLFSDPQDAEQDGNYTYLSQSVVSDACPEGVNKSSGCIPFYTEGEGDTSVRASGDLGDQTTAPSGCLACSFDPDVCGYDGEVPCCNTQIIDPASGESCSIFASDADPAGTPAAVRYCLNDGPYPLPNNEANVRTCEEDPAAGCVVANDSAGPPIATNCGGASQPACCLGPDGVLGGPASDDSEDTNRLCTDYGCDANIVLDVNQDRECAAWLFCSDSQQIERKNGDIEQVCFARKLCHKWVDGRCADPDDEDQVNITAEAPAIPYTREDLKNRTGLVVGGLSFGCELDGELVVNTKCRIDADCQALGLDACRIFEGNWPYGEMQEEGIASQSIGISDDKKNASFEQKDSALNDTASGAKFEEWEEDNGATLHINRQSFDENFANRYVEVTSGNTAQNGVQVQLDDVLVLDESVDFYTVSFRALRVRSSVTDADSLVVSLGQDNDDDHVVDSILWTVTEPIRLSNVWRRYTAKLVNNPSNVLTKVGGGPVYLLFRHNDGNPINESFSLDDIDVDPVLRVRDRAAATGGLLLGDDGLIGEYYESSTQIVDPGILGVSFYTGDNFGGIIYNSVADGIDSYEGTAGSVCTAGDPVMRNLPCTANPDCGVGGVCSANDNYCLAGDPAKIYKPCAANADCDLVPGDGLCRPDQDPLAGDPVTRCLSPQSEENTLCPMPNADQTCNGALPAGGHTICKNEGLGLCTAGTPGTCRWDTDCGVGGVCTQINSAVWTGYLSVPADGDYRFYASTNDGIRLTIDGNALINVLGIGIATKGIESPVTTLTAGWHQIMVEWRNTAGRGGLQLGWKQNGDTYDVEFCGGFGRCGLAQLGGQPAIPQPYLIPSSALARDLVSNRDFATFRGTRTEGPIDFNPVDANFQTMIGRREFGAVRWSGYVLANSGGDIAFGAAHDDGIRLYVNNNLVIDQWNNGAGFHQTPPLALGSGPTNWIPITLEYYQDRGASAAILLWDTGAGVVVIPTTGCAFNAGGTCLVSGVTDDVLADYVGRSCRSYPSDDAPRCEYDDPSSKTSYRGWKGYCVEPDPRNPRDCLNWWPVDVLTGEESIFGDQEQSVVRANLAYCLEAEPRNFSFDNTPANVTFPRIICIQRSANHGASNDACEKIAVVSDPTPKLWDYLDGTSSASWILGEPYPAGQGGFNGLGHGNILANDQEDCCIIFGVTGDLDDTDEDCRFPGTAFAGSFNSPVTMSMLKEAYNKVVYIEWTEGDSPVGCNNDNGDVQYKISDAFQHQCTSEDSNPANPADRCTSGPRPTADMGPLNDVDIDGFAMNGNASFQSFPKVRSIPLQCKTIVQVADNQGDAVPWAKRILGGYTTSPLTYSLSNQCTPYGALPAIDSPQFLDQHVGLFNGDTGYFPTQGIGPAAVKFTSTDVCRDVRFGNGLYASGTQKSPPAPANTWSLERVCVNGPDDGRSCSQAIDCRRNADGLDGNCSSTCFYDATNKDPLTTTCIPANTPCDEKLRTTFCTADATCTAIATNSYCLPHDAMDVYFTPFNSGFTSEPASDITEVPPVFTFGPVNSGEERLRLLFADAFDIWEWNNSPENGRDGRYVRVRPDSLQRSWDAPQDTGLDGVGYHCFGNVRPRLPGPDGIVGTSDDLPDPLNEFCGVRPDTPLKCLTGPSQGAICTVATEVVDCGAPNSCGFAVLVDGQTPKCFRGNVNADCTVATEFANCGLADSCGIVLSGGDHTINYEFQIRVDAEQTPMKNIAVDWGDERRSNYEETTVSHTYNCNEVRTDLGNSTECDANCPGDGVAADIDGISSCVYAGPDGSGAPRFQVMDNWGFCNNRTGNAGCEDPGIGDTTSWNYWAGKIIVQP